MAQYLAVVLTVFAVMLWMVLLAAVVAGALAVRRIAAKASATSARARERVRALGGTQRAQAERLRQRLRDAVLRTRSTLDHALTNQWPVGDTPMLLRRIEQAAGVLDLHLLAIAGERAMIRPGPELGSLERLTERVTDLVDACAQLRSGLREGALDLSEGETRTIRDACRIERQALLAWRDHRD
jgi:hypothetical protein